MGVAGLEDNKVRPSRAFQSMLIPHFRTFGLSHSHSTNSGSAPTVSRPSS
jgi:hypothetical protein